MAESLPIGKLGAAEGAVGNTFAAQREIAARLERLPMTGLRRKARIIVGTATFFDGFDAISIAQAMPVLVGLWKLQPGDVGFLISGGFSASALAPSACRGSPSAMAGCGS